MATNKCGVPGCTFQRAKPPTPPAGDALELTPEELQACWVSTDMRPKGGYWNPYTVARKQLAKVQAKVAQITNERDVLLEGADAFLRLETMLQQLEIKRQHSIVETLKTAHGEVKAERDTLQAKVVELDHLNDTLIVETKNMGKERDAYRERAEKGEALLRESLQWLAKSDTSVFEWDKVEAFEVKARAHLADAGPGECPRCDGTGYHGTEGSMMHPKHPCAWCHGTGKAGPVAKEGG